MTAVVKDIVSKDPAHGPQDEHAEDLVALLEDLPKD